MEMTEHIALYLRGYGFPQATSGEMPATPDRALTVYATGVRPRRDQDGSRFQILVRSEPGTDTALQDALYVADLLDDFEGMLTPDGPYFQRIELQSGAANLGLDANRRLTYSLNFIAYTC